MWSFVDICLQKRKCLGIPAFFRCIEPEVAIRCGAAGKEIVASAIDAFGCKLNSAENSRFR